MIHLFCSTRKMSSPPKKRIRFQEEESQEEEGSEEEESEEKEEGYDSDFEEEDDDKESVEEYYFSVTENQTNLPNEILLIIFFHLLSKQEGVDFLLSLKSLLFVCKNFFSLSWNERNLWTRLLKDIDESFLLPKGLKKTRGITRELLPSDPLLYFSSPLKIFDFNPSILFHSPLPFPFTNNLLLFLYHFQILQDAVLGYHQECHSNTKVWRRVEGYLCSIKNFQISYTFFSKEEVRDLELEWKIRLPLKFRAFLRTPRVKPPDIWLVLLFSSFFSATHPFLLSKKEHRYYKE